MKNIFDPTKKFNKEDIDRLHTEALIVNEEIKKIREMFPFDATPNSVLAESIISEKVDTVRDHFFNNPEIQNMILQDYKEIKQGDFKIFVDPEINPLFHDNLNAFLGLLCNKELCRAALNSFNSILPEGYREIDPDNIPPMFIHSEERAKYIFNTPNPPPGLNTSEKEKESNVHIVFEKSAMENSFKVLFHELVHCCEPEGLRIKHPEIIEGIARLIELKMFGESSHESFIKNYIYSFKRDFQKSMKHDIVKNFFNIAMREAMTDKKQKPQNWDEDYDSVALLNKYSLSASFIDWYQENYKKDFLKIYTEKSDFYKKLDEMVSKIPYDAGLDFSFVKKSGFDNLAYEINKYELNERLYAIEQLIDAGIYGEEMSSAILALKSSIAAGLTNLNKEYDRFIFSKWRKMQGRGDASLF